MSDHERGFVDTEETLSPWLIGDDEWDAMTEEQQRAILDAEHLKAKEYDEWVRRHREDL